MNDRYRLLTRLGEGGFGCVHLAQDLHTGRRVAIKQLRFDTPDARARFEREARTLLRNVDNAHVVEILDHDLSATPPYLVLEYCEHGSLRSWVGTRVSWQNVAGALAHAVNGLQGIHQAGGFHRDVKPDNLLVASDPRDSGRSVIIKVADFGLARDPQSATSLMTRSPAGTDGYIAPEVRAGSPFTAAADIFSLGIVACELLTGERSTSRIGSTPIPDRFRRVVRSMLSPIPGQRPGARTVAAELSAILAEPAEATTEKANASGIGGVVFGGLLAGGALLALAALAGGNDKEWDNRVKRHRSPDGRFSS